MLTEEQVAEFHENGFLNGGPVLDDAQVEVLREDLYRVIAMMCRNRFCCAIWAVMIRRRSGRL